MESPLSEVNPLAIFLEMSQRIPNKQFICVYGRSYQVVRKPMWWSYPNACNVLAYVQGLINQTRRPPGRLKGGVSAPPVKKSLNFILAVQTLPG